MCIDICTINIRVNIRVRGLHLVLCLPLLLAGVIPLPIYLSMLRSFLAPSADVDARL